MLVNRLVNDSRGLGREVVLEEPSQCPLCHFAIKPLLLHSQLFPHGPKSNVSESYFCNHCSQPFISFYEDSGEKTTLGSIVYPLFKPLYTGPTRYQEIEFDQMLSDLSPRFVKIYNQAARAESSNLDEIAGIGYRKALEFLIKDFCVHKHPEVEETIKKSFLGNCINDYISVPNLQTLAKKAAWIGNDETHYVREYEDRDINDLKKFISACVHYVTMELTVEDADSIQHSKS